MLTLFSLSFSSALLSSSSSSLPLVDLILLYLCSCSSSSTMSDLVEPIIPLSIIRGYKSAVPTPPPYPPLRNQSSVYKSAVPTPPPYPPLHNQSSVYKSAVPTPPPYPTLHNQSSVYKSTVPTPPPYPPLRNQSSVRHRFRSDSIDLEANLPHFVEPPPPNIPNPIEARQIVIIHNHNLVDRIWILVGRIWIIIANLFTRIRLLVVSLRTLIANLFARIWIFFAYLFARINIFFANLFASSFFLYLVKRTEEFRPEEGPHEMKPRFVMFQSDSTLTNDRLWRFFKGCYVVNMWLMVLCVVAGVGYWLFGEGSGSNPKSFRFKDKSMVNPVVAVGLVFTVVYWCWVFHEWNELKLFKIRSYHIGFLALDIICDLRCIKTVALTCYGLYDLAKMYGVWTDIFFVGFPVFYSIWSISILILFQHEFYHAHGLINDFIVIFVGPMILQFAHGSFLNGVLYTIPIVFGRLSKFLGFIYRPHVTDDFYDPTKTGN